MNEEDYYLWLVNPLNRVLLEKIEKIRVIYEEQALNGVMGAEDVEKLALDYTFNCGKREAIQEILDFIKPERSNKSESQN